MLATEKYCYKSSDSLSNQNTPPQISLHRNLELPLTTAAAAKSLQSCPTLNDPMDCSLPGSSIHGILPARVLEWGAIAFTKQ